MLGTVGVDPADPGDAIAIPMHDDRDMTLRQHRTASAGLRLGDEGDICAALVGARATVGTLTAVVAAGPALPGFGKDCQGIWQPAHAQPGTSAADALVGVAMRVGWQRIGPAARTMAIMPWAGNTDQVLCLDVETFQFTVGNRPVSADTEAAGHAHRHRMEAVRFTDETQGAAPHAPDVLVFQCPPSVAGSLAEIMVPRSQLRPL